MSTNKPQDMVSTSPRHDASDNLPEESPGYRSFPPALIEAHEAQPIDKQRSITLQGWRTLTYTTLERAKRFASRVSRSEMNKLHSLVQLAGIADDHAYKGQDGTGKGPAHVLIQLFGQSGVGESIVRNLTAMIPDVIEAEALPGSKCIEMDTTKPPRSLRKDARKSNKRASPNTNK